MLSNKGLLRYEGLKLLRKSPLILAATCYILCRLTPCDCIWGMQVCSYPAGGGVKLRKDVHEGRGVKGKAEKCGKGGGRGSNIPEILRTSFMYGP